MATRQRRMTVRPPATASLLRMSRRHASRHRLELLVSTGAHVSAPTGTGPPGAGRLVACPSERYMVLKENATGGRCTSSAGSAGATARLLASDARGPARGRPAARPAGLLASDARGPARGRPAARPA